MAAATDLDPMALLLSERAAAHVGGAFSSGARTQLPTASTQQDLALMAFRPVVSRTRAS
jgi:hypothetical protein